jgi:hypothetical protein
MPSSLPLLSPLPPMLSKSVSRLQFRHSRLSIFEPPCPNEPLPPPVPTPLPACYLHRLPSLRTSPFLRLTLTLTDKRTPPLQLLHHPCPLISLEPTHGTRQPSPTPPAPPTTPTTPSLQPRAATISRMRRTAMQILVSGSDGARSRSSRSDSNFPCRLLTLPRSMDSPISQHATLSLLYSTRSTITLDRPLLLLSVLNPDSSTLSSDSSNNIGKRADPEELLPALIRLSILPISILPSSARDTTPTLRTETSRLPPFQPLLPSISPPSKKRSRARPLLLPPSAPPCPSLHQGTTTIASSPLTHLTRPRATPPLDRLLRLSRFLISRVCRPTRCRSLIAGRGMRRRGSRLAAAEEGMGQAGLGGRLGRAMRWRVITTLGQALGRAEMARLGALRKGEGRGG